ncbi:hypothetical protein ACQKMI_13295 [Lysinibacillus sp. NPDC097214]|uniref:hypothetical protein n=1 Tax=Lysinibacillus sp. NPDC097214 TaxID=3390584 RepID=UPI003D09195B
MITFLENAMNLAFIIIVISSAIYCRKLKLTKWKRKLSKGEMTMYILTATALPIYGILYLVFLFEK